MHAAEFFSRRQVAYTLATLTCILWGSSYPAIKAGYALFEIVRGDIASQLVFAGYRFFFAGLVLLVVAAVRLRCLPVVPAALRGRVLTLGLTQTTAQYLFFYIGLAYATGVKSSIMNSTMIFFSVLIAHCLYADDRITPRKAAGCLIGFLGVIAVNFGKGLLDFDFTLLGEGFVVIAAFILAAATIYGKRVSQHIDSGVLTGWQLSIGGAVLLAIGYGFGGSLGTVEVSSVLVLGYLVLMSAVTVSVWALLLKYNRVGDVAVFNFLVPVFGAFLSALFLGERIAELKYVIGLACVCSGIWLVTRDVAQERARTRSASVDQ